MHSFGRYCRCVIGCMCIILAFTLFYIGVETQHNTAYTKSLIANSPVAQQLHDTEAPTLIRQEVDCACHTKDFTVATHVVPPSQQLRTEIAALEQSIFASGEGLLAQSELDERYQTVLEMHAMASQMVYSQPENGLVIAQNARTLLAQLVLESENGYWVPPPTQPEQGAVASLSEIPNTRPIPRLLAWLAPAFGVIAQQNGSVLSLIGLCIVAWCVIYAVLRRAPPDAFNLNTPIFVGIRRALSMLMTSPFFIVYVGLLEEVPLRRVLFSCSTSYRKPLMRKGCI